MKSNFFVNAFLAGFALGLTGLATAQPFSSQDNAADALYTDGVQDGENGGTGFGPWDSVNSVFSSPIPIPVGTAASFGGAAEMETSNLVMALTGDQTVVHEAARPFAAQPDGSVFSFQFQSTNDPNITPFARIRTSSGDNLLTFQENPSTTSTQVANWFLTDGSGNQDLGILSTTPIQVFIKVATTPSVEYEITVVNLTDSSIVLDTTGTPASFQNAGEPGEFFFQCAGLFLSAGPRFLLINELIIDDTGTLPGTSVTDWTLLAD